MSTYPPYGPAPIPPGYLPPSYPALSPRVRPLTLVLVLILGLLAGFAAYRFVFDRGSPAVDPRPVTPRGDLAGDEKSTIDLFRKASPSVVFITTRGLARDFTTRNVFEVPQGAGSGFIWDNAGHVVTNYHVIREASSAQVTLNEHSTFAAELVGVAPEYDLAVLRIKTEASRLPPIAIGTSHDLQAGQKVFAIGNPFGLDQSLTTGVVSALGRTIQGIEGNEIEEVPLPGVERPADEAGRRPRRRTDGGQIIWGDVIQAVDGKPVRSVPELYRVLENYRAGDTVTLTVFRDGHQEDVKVQLVPGPYR